MMRCSFSENLRILRKRKNLSQKMLAERLHINKQAVYRWENEIAYPPVDFVYDIARALECDASQLFVAIEENEKFL